jgi:phosphomannomutase
MDIKFGTDGWRGVVGEDFTPENVLRIAEAVNCYLKIIKECGHAVVGFDCRRQGEESALLLAAWLLDCGHKVELAAKPCPSPAVSAAINAASADVGIMITASHNPPEYNGVKFKGSYGGSFTPELVAKIEQHLPNKSPLSDRSPAAFAAGLSDQIERVDLNSIQLERLLDYVGPIDLSSLHIVVDCMHGSGVNVLPAALEKLGAKVTLIRDQRDINFGGHNPEPLDRTTKELAASIKSENAHLGFCMDGDADRISARDDNGEFVDSHRFFALLLKHLVRNKMKRGLVVRTQTTSSMIDKLCIILGVDLKIVAVGFKHICNLMLEGGVLIGGEESGGIGISDYLPERDAALCALLLSESLVDSGELKLSKHIENLFNALGVHEFGRQDLHIDGDAKKLVENISADPPTEIGNFKVEQVDALDGIKFYFQSGWLMMRPSGTEPLVRVYSESTSRSDVESILAAGVELIQQRLSKAKS